MVHDLPIQPRYAALIDSGDKRHEYRLSSVRTRSIRLHDLVRLRVDGQTQLIVRVVAIRHYSSLAALDEQDVPDSGFDSLQKLRTALSRIYWYARDRALIRFSIEPIQALESPSKGA